MTDTADTDFVSNDEDEVLDQAEETEGEDDAEITSPTAPGTGKTRHELPDGVISPIKALNHLKQQGHVVKAGANAGKRIKAPKDFKPQQMYGFVKNPGKVDPFPVKHYDAAGVEYDTPQVHSETGVTVTRPGVKLHEVGEWWSRADQRKAEKDKIKADKAAEKKRKEEEKAAAAKATDETADEEAADNVDAEFEDVDAEEAQ
jgi:hypothetical protein